jgi:23S rRNA (cytosine1962-C5)-methyltransferase
MKRIIVKKGADIRIKHGHPWVWDNEIERVLEGKGEGAVPATLVPGETADVETAGKSYLGRAFVNPRSKITARIYSPSKEGVDAGFFKRRIREALERRSVWYDLNRESCRIVFAEADFLPGLIIDRFVGWPFDDNPPCLGDTGTFSPGYLPPLTFEQMEKENGPPAVIFSIQLLTYAMDARRDQILEALPDSAGVYEKSAVKARELEGLSLREGVLRGKAAGMLFFENGLPFTTRFDNSQKTGHFFDQARHHALAGRLVTGLRRESGEETAISALDCFCYTGGFAIHLARAGARVAACDTSENALSTLKTNAFLNGVGDSVETIKDDVFNMLTEQLRQKRRYRVIILDPPAFAKTQVSKTAALRGYKELNLKAMRLLEPGGVLMTCSCSEAVDEWVFRKTIQDAAEDAGRRLHLLRFSYQAPDHPILVGYAESLYLKCALYRVL